MNEMTGSSVATTSQVQSGHRMMRRAGKDCFLEILRQEGVRHIFGNPGTTELPLIDALSREREIEYVLSLQEAVTVAMADGYAQAAGSLAVANVHVAPGLGNAMGMLYDAYRAGSPLILTAGQHDQSLVATEPVLWADLPHVAQPYTKWAVEVRRIEDLPRIVHRAAKVAMTPPTGPVFLSLPVDVLNATAEVDVGAPTRVAPGIRPSPKSVQHVVAMLEEAERPVFLLGDAVAQNAALVEAATLAEQVGADVYAEGMTNRCSFPFTHPLYLGALPRVGAQLNAVLKDYDLLVSIGAELFNLALPSPVEPMPRNIATIHIDVDPWELGKNHPTDLAIAADPKAALEDIVQAFRHHCNGKHPRAEERAKDVATRRQTMIQDLRSQAERGRPQPMAPITFVAAIADAVTPETVIVDESISSHPGLRELLPCRDAQAFFGLRGGGIGWGLPAAVGVKIALPARPVVALVGDGSALYSIQALWTAAREELGIVFVIVNNKSYRILKQRVHSMGGYSAENDQYVGLDLDRPEIDFCRMAESLGVTATRTASPDDVVDLVQDAIRSNKPCLIDVLVDGAFKG